VTCLSRDAAATPVKANRKAVGGGAKKAVVVRPPSPKTEEELALIGEALRRNEALTTMISLDAARIQELADKMWKETVPVGKLLIEQGDFNADYFYVVQEGKFSYMLSHGVGAISSAIVVGQANVGDSFGELALLYLVPRAATVKADVPSVVWVIDRPSFKSILMRQSNDKIKQYVALQDKVGLLAKLSQDDKQKVAEALQEKTFLKGELILKQGDPGHTFFILVEGEVAVLKDNAQGKQEQVAKLKASADESHVFGERALQKDDVRAASIQVVSTKCKALALDRETFDKVLGNHRIAHHKSKCSLASVEAIKKEELEKVALLGCGGFGVVELWKHKVTSKPYALKGLNKGYIVKTGQQANVLNEKQLMLMCDSPFIIKLYACYNEDQNLFFLLEPARGGEVYTLYEKLGLSGSVEHAKFYAAGVLMAFQHLQERYILYRDLKPENLLLDEEGHAKLCDFGLAKCTVVKTYTTCGTPDYFAPEMIMSSGHSSAVDWWTFGVIIFEWLGGQAPFQDAVPMKIFQRVKRGIDKVKFPKECREGGAEELIKGLLKSDPSERLPCLTGGVDNIKKASWYAGFDWQAFADRKMEPPWKPEVTSQTDIGAFEASAGDMPPALLYDDDGTMWDQGFAT